MLNSDEQNFCADESARRTIEELIRLDFFFSLFYVTSFASEKTFMQMSLLHIQCADSKFA